MAETLRILTISTAPSRGPSTLNRALEYPVHILPILCGAHPAEDIAVTVKALGHFLNSVELHRMPTGGSLSLLSHELPKLYTAIAQHHTALHSPNICRTPQLPRALNSRAKRSSHARPGDAALGDLVRNVTTGFPNASADLTEFLGNLAEAACPTRKGSGGGPKSPVAHGPPCSREEEQGGVAILSCSSGALLSNCAFLPQSLFLHCFGSKSLIGTRKYHSRVGQGFSL